MNYGKKHDLPFGIMDVAGLLRLNIRRRAPGQVYVDCPICGDRRGKMNLNTAKDLWRCNYCGEGGGMLSLYAKVYGVSNSDAYREICDALAVNGFSPDYTVPEKTTPAEAEQSDAASVQEVHQTLSMLLSMLTLIPAHRAHLQSVRGLSDDEITRFGFKSTPPPFLCRSLTNRLVKAGCRVQGVPGFYVDDNGCWTVKFHQRTSGIIIPIFGVDGLIHGAQIRLDHPLKDKDDPPEKTGVKYLTLSSTGKRMGTTSGSPIHFVGDPCSRVVYVTEGCLKADVAHALMHRTFVATLGANNTAKLDELFAFLHRNGTEEIIEAEDMDKYRNTPGSPASFPEEIHRSGRGTERQSGAALRSKGREQGPPAEALFPVFLPQCGGSYQAGSSSRSPSMTAPNAKCAPLSGNSRCEASPSPMMLEAAAPACALCALMSLICATKPSA